MKLTINYLKIIGITIVIHLSSLFYLKVFAQNKSVAGSSAIILQQPVNDDRIKNRSFEQVSSIASTTDGKQIYIAWYTGGKGEGPGNYVTLAVSLDSGKTWKNDQLIVLPYLPTSRIFDPGLWRDPLGNIWLFYANSQSKMWDLKGGVNAANILWDGSKVIYKNHRRISDGIMINKPIFIPKKNLALFPVSVWKLDKTDRSKDSNYVNYGTFVHQFKYHKKFNGIDTLAPYSAMPFPDSIRTYDEHQIVQTSEKGDLLGLIRTKKGILYATSTNYGKTWSEAQPFTLTGPNTQSRFHISRLTSGNLLLILNDSKTRTNMTAFLSKDGGRSWPYKLLLDDRDMISYPDASQTKDGTIHVTYDRDRFGIKDILYTHFKEEDVEQGDGKNIPRVRVNPI